MNFLKSIATPLIVLLLISATGSSVKAIVDFRDLKTKVRKHDTQITAITLFICESIKENDGEKYKETMKKCLDIARGDQWPES